MFNFLFKNSVEKISASDAKERLKADKRIVLIDVRTESEHFTKRIPSSINIPLDKIMTIESVIPNKDSTLFVYCLSGGRAASACNQLSKMGYKNIYNLGGINGWNYETISGKRVIK
jgi:phage shock protein E